MTIRDAHRPLGEHVHTLTGTDAGRQQVRWSSVSHGKQDKADLAADLGRIQAEPKMREEVRKRMHHGRDGGDDERVLHGGASQRP